MCQASCAAIFTSRDAKSRASGPEIPKVFVRTCRSPGARNHTMDLIYFNDIHSGLWIVKLGEKIDKGSTTAPGH